MTSSSRDRSKTRPARCAALWPLLAVAALALAPPARAGLAFEVSLGLDGHVAASSWFPLTCEIFNDGPGFNGLIEIQSTHGRGLTQLMPVELPAHTRKRVSLALFAPPAGLQSWDARLLDDRGRVRAEQPRLRPRQIISADSRLIAALPRAASGLPVLPDHPPARAQMRPVVARLTPDSWPDTPLLLEGVSALYLNAARAADLKPPQVNALLAWLLHGGHLIVGIEQAGDVNALPWLRQLLPCALGAGGTLTPGDAFHHWLPNPVLTSQSAPHAPAPAGKKSPATATAPDRLPPLAPDAQLAGATLSYVTAMPHGAKVLLAAPGGTPLILQGRAQRGRVTVLTFNPERDPFLSWPHRTWFWARLAEVPLEVWTGGERAPGRGRHLDAVFALSVESRQGGKLPLAALFALLLAYLLVIGPGERHLLRRLRREMWTWLTFPLLVGAFATLIYFIGYKLRAGDTEWNELHIVDVARSGEGALLRGRTCGAVYSTAHQRYRFQADDAGPGALRGEVFAGAGGGGPSDDDSRLIRSGEGLRVELHVPVWTSRLLVHDWHRSADVAPLEFRVRETAEEWLVELRNKLPRPLARAHVIAAHRWHPIGPLAAGESRTVVLRKTAGAPLPAFVRDHWPAIEQAVNERQSSFHTGEEPARELPPIEALGAASFYSLAGAPPDHRRFEPLPGFDLAADVERGDVVLLAWVPGHAALPPLNQFAAPRSRRDTLFRLVTTPTPALP